jgi:arogenate dehydrogenase (NADP+)
VGAGNAEMGMMMAEYNRDALLKSLYGYRDRLDRTIELIEMKQWTEIQSLLTANQTVRHEFLNSAD